MGMASFVDRIRDLVNDAMHLRGLWEARAPTVTPEVTEPVPHDVDLRTFADDLQKRLDAYGRLLDNIIQQLNELLEYATDPTLKLVEEVMQLRIARDSLLGQLNHACKERDALQAEVRKIETLLQQAQYAKKHAEFAEVRLQEELGVRAAAHQHDLKSLKGELASKDRLHDEGMNSLRTQQRVEIARPQAAHNIEMSDLRRWAEKVANKPISAKDQSRQEEFVALLSNSSSPRVSTPSMPVKKEASNNPKKRR